MNQKKFYDLMIRHRQWLKDGVWPVVVIDAWRDMQITANVGLDDLAWAYSKNGDATKYEAETFLDMLEKRAIENYFVWTDEDARNLDHVLIYPLDQDGEIEGHYIIARSMEELERILPTVPVSLSWRWKGER